jgi:hypothetical protein
LGWVEYWKASWVHNWCFVRYYLAVRIIYIII